jgi:ethylbenzene dehydrogenase
VWYISALIIIGVLIPCVNAGTIKKPEESRKDISRSSSKSAIYVKQILRPPFLDGKAIDKCWQEIPTTKIEFAEAKKLLPLYLKACNDGKKIYFLIQYPTSRENIKHQRWHWNPVLQAYMPGKEKEESFTIILASQNRDIKKADIWVWRAARTDPVNKADDMIYQKLNLVNHPTENISMDKGKNCWFSKYFGDFAGAKLPRFYNRTPKGSLADVNAKGAWDMNFLTIEFSRLLATGSKDDVQLKPGKYYIQIQRGTPNINSIKNIPFLPLIL